MSRTTKTLSQLGWERAQSDWDNYQPSTIAERRAYALRFLDATRLPAGAGIAVRTSRSYSELKRRLWAHLTPAQRHAKILRS